jgi:VPDSG-CTERM motif
MRFVLRLVLGFALVLGMASGVQAGQVTISFSFNTTADQATSNSGLGTLFADDLGGNQYGAYGGSLTMTSGPATGLYDLYSKGSPYAVFTSPSGAFNIDSQVTIPGNPSLDASGLLFVLQGATLPEINIWGNSVSNYSFYVWNGGAYSPAIDGFSDFEAHIVPGTLAVPDGGTTLMLLGGALVGLGALRRKFRG